MTEKYLLKGLHCADCGEKIRAAASRFEGVKQANLNVATGLLTLICDKEIETAALQRLCDSVEAGITVVCEGDASSSAPKKGKWKQYAWAASALVLIVGAVVCGLLQLPKICNLLLGAATGVNLVKPMFYGIKSVLKNRTFDEKLLLAIAAVSALAIGEYAEGAAVTLLFEIGEIIESRVTSHSRKGIEALGNIRPQRVHTDEGDLPAAQIKVGDVIVVHPFERIPLDGMIVGGSGHIDPSAITGESIPISVEYGTPVLGGMIAGSVALRVQVTADYENSAPARIIKMVENSEARKGTAQRFISRFAKIYTPLTVLAALLVALIPWLVTGEFSSLWFKKALVLLVASCPCAMVISVPLAFYAGIGAASKKGVLVKGGIYLESLAAADCVISDKTGTLTTGELKVTEVHSEPGYDCLAIASWAERYSGHPVAAAIRRACPHPQKIEGEIREQAGYGIVSEGEQRILVGSVRLMSQEGVDVSHLPRGQVYVAVDGRGIGSIQLSDLLRDDALDTLNSLRRLGVKSFALLSGDNAPAVKRTAEACGIDYWRAELLPEDKVECLREFKQKCKSVVFVGDGINDAPVITEATVGVGMGLGTDAAVETADVVLTAGNLSALADGVKTSRRTLKKVRFNIALSLAVKGLVMLSALFVPMMWMAVVADVGLSVVCCLNSAALLKSR